MENGARMMNIYREAERCLPALTEEEWDVTNRALVRRIQAGDRAAEDELVKRNFRLVVKTVKEITKYNFEDCVQAGLIGLCKAAPRFEFDHETKFITYATWWIRDEIYKEIRMSGQRRLHSQDRWMVRRLDEFSEKFILKNQRRPTVEELAMEWARVQLINKNKNKDKPSPTAKEVANLALSMRKTILLYFDLKKPIVSLDTISECRIYRPLRSPNTNTPVDLGDKQHPSPLVVAEAREELRRYLSIYERIAAEMDTLKPLSRLILKHRILAAKRDDERLTLRAIGQLVAKTNGSARACSKSNVGKREAELIDRLTKRYQISKQTLLTLSAIVENLKELAVI